ncbi:hypothetical protein CYLTODRAFT_457748 [Cylindrobasidium torrendii FP15055 ss-10]|uniref:Uncharacterized protein n=1 Tax=Cylindrobasidium torrendii FP15055 ss-10 TaxID=1314674 RepID=A0A0D7B113_9AGAR|nr:hypothetical protein CYLTODRAFT_457748 [Cylindrobasidium torrendii FP15055 ss-10]
MITLLHLCYPAYLSKNKIVHEHIDGALMKALDKYLMEGVFEYMKEIIEDDNMVKKNPLKIYAIARNLGWDDLTRRAAREALKFGILTAEPIPELKLISGHEYQLLIRYFSACSTAVTRFLRPAVLNNTQRILARNRIPEHIAQSVFACSPSSQPSYSKNQTCSHTGCYIIVGTDINHRTSHMMHAWFVDYIREIFEDVSLRPGHGVIISPTKIEEILIKAETQCATQKPTAVRALLEWLNTEIDYIINQVTLEL